MEIKLQSGNTLESKNLPIYLDIEADIAVHKEGLLNISLKCNRGFISDYVWYENSNNINIPIRNNAVAKIDNNLRFYTMIDMHARRLMYGQVTYTGMIKDGIVVGKINYTYAKRRRYKT